MTMFLQIWMMMPIIEIIIKDSSPINVVEKKK